MTVLTFRDDARLGRSHEDLGGSIDGNEDDGFEVRKRVVEVDQGGYEDEDVEDEGSDVAESHCGGREEKRRKSRWGLLMVEC